MPIRHHGSPERIWLDDRVEAVAFDHANYCIDKFSGRSVLAYIYMYLIIPKKFIAQFFFEPASEFLRQCYGVNCFAVNAVPEIMALSIF